MDRSVPALAIHFPAGATDDERGIVSAILSDFSTAAIHELNDSEWRVFFRSAPDRDAAAAPLAGRCAIESLDVPAEDWARKSQESLRAIAVGNIVVAPPWDLPEARGQTPEVGTDPLVIVIEPSTGFGTGHHATTRLCLRALQRIELHGKSVIDVGTGSGILAIVAALRGASPVIAVDNDPDALEAARANIDRNCAAIDLRRGDVESLSLPRANVVVANLTGAMLRSNAAALLALAPSGTLILSGFLLEEVLEVERAFGPYSRSCSCETEDGWGCLVSFTPATAHETR